MVTKPKPRRSTRRVTKTRILFVLGFGPIVRDMKASRKLYCQALQIPFKEEGGGYLHTDALRGVRERDRRARSKGISNAHQEQDRTLGADREPFPRSRWTAGGADLHAGHARRQVAGSPVGYPRCPIGKAATGAR